jgi:hypothetical protein
METNDTPLPREDDPARKDDRNEEAEASPVPDPEEEQGDAEDVPQAD